MVGVAKFFIIAIWVVIILDLLLHRGEYTLKDFKYLIPFVWKKYHYQNILFKLFRIGIVVTMVVLDQVVLEYDYPISNQDFWGRLFIYHIAFGMYLLIAKALANPGKPEW